MTDEVDQREGGDQRAGDLQPLAFLGLLPVKLEKAEVRHRLFEPIEKLRGGIDLVVVSALWEDGHLMEVFGNPGCSFRNMNKAVLDQCSLRMQPHDLVAFGLVPFDRMAAFDDELLDQLSSGRLVLDQDDVSMSVAIARAADFRMLFSPAMSACRRCGAARYLTMNGKRRLLGSFWHGSMGNAMAQAIGAQAAAARRSPREDPA